MNPHTHEALYENARARLLELGHEPTSGPAELSWVWQTFRHNCLAGEFTHLPLFVPRNRAVVDIGANVGQYSLMLASLAPEVIAVDALPDHAKVTAALPRSCSWHATALGREPGRATLHIPRRDGKLINGMASLEDLAPHGHADCAEVDVSVARLDDLLEAHPPRNPIGFMKLDVEGHEFAVLEGGRRTLERWRPNLQLEIWEDRFDEGVRFLDRLGYQGLFFFEGGLSRDQPV